MAAAVGLLAEQAHFPTFPGEGAFWHLALLSPGPWACALHGPPR